MRSLGVGSQGEHPPWAQGAGRHDYQGKHAMKTDDLIAMLSTNTEAVYRKLVIRTVWIAVVAGILVAGGRALVGVGLPTRPFAERALVFLFNKPCFCFGVVRPA